MTEDALQPLKRFVATLPKMFVLQFLIWSTSNNVPTARNRNAQTSLMKFAVTAENKSAKL